MKANSLTQSYSMEYSTTNEQTQEKQAPAIIAVDLHTGEQWMFRNNTILSFGQIFYFNSYNY